MKFGRCNLLWFFWYLSFSALDVRQIWLKYDYCFHHSTRDIPPLNEQELERIEGLTEVQVLFRHGSRSPLNADYPQVGPQRNLCAAFPHDFNCTYYDEFLDPSLKFSFLPSEGGNCLPGQLIDRGIRDMERVGEALKAGYFGPRKDQFNKPLSSDQIYAYSSWVERTRLSLHALITKMFPDIASSIKAYSLPEEKRLMNPPPGCYEFDRLGRFDINDVQLINFLKARGYTEQQLVEIIDIFRHKVSADPEQAIQLFDCLSCKICDGMSISTHGVDFEFLEHLTELAYSLNEYAGNKQKDFAVRGLYGMIVEQLEKMDEYPVVLWSAHDSTIMWVLNNLGIWDGAWPQYASSLSFEIYKMNPNEDFDLGFRLVFNGKVMRLPGCTRDLCSYSVLSNALTKFALSRDEFYATCYTATHQQQSVEVLKNMLYSAYLSISRILGLIRDSLPQFTPMIVKTSGSLRFLAQFAFGIGLCSCLAFFCWKRDASSSFPYASIPE